MEIEEDELINKNSIKLPAFYYVYVWPRSCSAILHITSSFVLSLYPGRITDKSVKYLSQDGIYRIVSRPPTSAFI